MSFSEVVFALVLFAVVLAVPCSVALAMFLKGQRRPYYQLRR
jgi:ABC-type phosphate transport system permease subunit